MTATLATAAEADRLATLPKPGSPDVVRERLREMLRRNLVGPYPDLDADLTREVLANESPANWYLTASSARVPTS